MDQAIFEEEWDVLLIFDGCRYDEFEKYYGDYFRGELQKRKSKGSTSSEWAVKTFNQSRDITYFSANPFINDLDMPLNEVERGQAWDYEWQPNNHISDIIDVWDFAWDESLGTVKPGKLNEVVLENHGKLENSDRVIIHYLQPHTPFIPGGKGRIISGIRDSFLKEKNGSEANEGFVSELTKSFVPFLEEWIGDREFYMRMGYALDMRLHCMLDVLKNGFTETVRKYHENNLELVMEHAREIVEEVDGDVVITADHGDAFGEQGVWAHPIETHIPALVEVPWFRVEGAK